jgi:hypothetical protein
MCVCVCVCVCVYVCVCMRIAQEGIHRRAVALDGETCGISARFPKVEYVVIAP